MAKKKHSVRSRAARRAASPEADLGIPSVSDNKQHALPQDGRTKVQEHLAEMSVRGEFDRESLKSVGRSSDGAIKKKKKQVSAKQKKRQQQSMERALMAKDVLEQKVADSKVRHKLVADYRKTEGTKKID